MRIGRRACFSLESTPFSKLQGMPPVKATRYIRGRRSVQSSRLSRVRGLDCNPVRFLFECWRLLPERVRMRFGRSLLIVVTFAGIGASSAPAARAETKLALKFPSGKPIRQQMLQATTIAVTPPGEEKAYTTQIDQSWVLESKIGKVLDSGAAVVHEHFNRIAMTIQLPPPVGKRISADTAQPKESDDKSERELREALSKVLGLDWHITRKPDGEISEVGLSDELSDLLVDNPQVGPLADTFTDAGLRKLWNQATIVLPDRPVSEEDAWKQSVAISLPTGKLTTERLCTYAGTVGDGLEKITVKLSATFDPAKDARQKWELTANSGQGELLLDNQAGRFVRSKFTQNLTLEEGPKDRRGRQQIKIVTTLLPAEEPADQKK
jgi:hypothetical protein